jgi:hypothetical protein
LTTQTEVRVENDINTVYTGYLGSAFSNVWNTNHGETVAFVFTSKSWNDPWYKVWGTKYRATWIDSTKSVIKNSNYLETDDNDNVNFEDCSTVSLTMNENPNKMADGGWLLHTMVYSDDGDETLFEVASPWKDATCVGTASQCAKCHLQVKY